jgi:hypothetical protein
MEGTEEVSDAQRAAQDGPRIAFEQQTAQDAVELLQRARRHLRLVADILNDKEARLLIEAIDEWMLRI